MNDEEKSKLVDSSLVSNKRSSWLDYSDSEINKIFEFCEDYKKFVGKNKTERECIDSITSLLKSNGFNDITKVNKLNEGDRVYYNLKGKALIACIVGKSNDKIRIIASHIDSPRLDLKPNPLFEDSDIALLKTHYYGGIKKYQWVNVPLSLHGVIFTKSGKKVEIVIGEDEKDPAFIIPDLLIHLSTKQLKKKAESVIEGEKLRILFGNIPIRDDKFNEKVKMNVLNLLNKKHGVIEEDFNCAEFELVPRIKPMDVGIDKSMLAAYGQDDRVCAYTSLRAFLDLKKFDFTSVVLFSDKEEIGSVGDTGAASFMLNNFFEIYSCLANLDKPINLVLSNAQAISADVTCAMDPNFKSVNDPQNVSYLGRGVSIEKYGGSGGKSYSNDSHAEYMAFIRKIADENRVPWQTGELGKVDMGSGGTIAIFLSRLGMDCVDVGPSVLGMHSPCEIVSKADIYSAYRLYKAFWSYPKFLI